MDPSNTFYSFITQFIESHKYLTKSAGSGGINTKSLDQRQVLLSQIESIKSSIFDCAERLQELYVAARQLQEEEIRALDLILGNVKSGRPSGTARVITAEKAVRTAIKAPGVYTEVKPSVNSVNSVNSLGVQRPRTLADPAWTLVQRKQKPADIIKTDRVPGPRILQQAPGNYERINITTSITVNAIPVKDFADVKCDGSLYYVTTCSHFALMINNLLFHGNIGIIYTDAEDPEKIKDCRFTDGCNRFNSCRYYHDPAIFADSNDRRNFIASSFIYTNPSAMYKNRSRSRRFGSLEHLDTDILGLSDEEKNRTYDQAMHDLLCAIVLKSIEPIKNK